MEEHQDYSLGSRVFQKIREDILNGRYKEHDEIRENTLGKELGVSRTPVREALRQLELEGLVSIVPNRGAYVTAITGKDIADIYAIRGLLEGLCAGWAVENIRPEELVVNTRRKMIAVVPAELPAGRYFMRVVSQCSTSPRPMREAVEFTLPVELECAAGPTA